jgi:FAD:protein FMN transferase
VTRTATAPIMGTMISIAAPDGVPAGLFEEAAGAAFAGLREADAVFSPFDPGSPVSRIRDGRLPVAEIGAEPAAAEIEEVLALCATLKRESSGAFDAWAVGDPPSFDPCGAVKGWAAERAGATLAGLGVVDHSLNAGGDIRVRGTNDGRSWRVGVADPHRRGRILVVVELSGGAVATSGSAERGAHVWDPRTGRHATDLAQVTVVGPDLTWADGYATAALAMGRDARDWLVALAARTGYQSLTVDRETGVWWTRGLADVAPVLRAASTN